MADKNDSPARAGSTRSDSAMEKKKQAHQKMLEWPSASTKDLDELQKAIAARKPIFPTVTNGRVEGRKLIKWDSHVNELLLLCIQYECHKQGIELPWDAIAMRLASEKNSSGASIIQHLNKRRKELLEAGSWVTPPMPRKNAQVVHDVRGIVKTGVKSGDIRYISWFEDASGLINPKDIEESRSKGGAWNVPKEAYPDEHYPTTQAELLKALKDDEEMRTKLGIQPSKVSCRAPSDESKSKNGDDSDSEEDSGPVSKRRRSGPKPPSKMTGNGKSARRHTGKSDDEYTGEGSRPSKRVKQDATEKRSTRVRTNKSITSPLKIETDDEDEAAEESSFRSSKIVVLKMSPVALRKLSTKGSDNTIQPQESSTLQAASEMDIDGPTTPVNNRPSGEFNNVASKVSEALQPFSKTPQLSTGSGSGNNVSVQPYNNTQSDIPGMSSGAHDPFHSGAGSMNLSSSPLPNMEMNFNDQNFSTPSTAMNYQEHNMVNPFQVSAQQDDQVSQVILQDGPQLPNGLDDGIDWDALIDFSQTEDSDSAAAASGSSNAAYTALDGAVDPQQYGQMGFEWMRRVNQPGSGAQHMNEMTVNANYQSPNIDRQQAPIPGTGTVDPKYLTLPQCGPGDAANLIHAMGPRKFSQVNFDQLQIPMIPQPRIDPNRIGLTETSSNPTLLDGTLDEETLAMKKMQLKYPSPSKTLPLPSSHMDFGNLQLQNFLSPNGQHQDYVSKSQKLMEDEEFLQLVNQMYEQGEL